MSSPTDGEAARSHLFSLPEVEHPNAQQSVADDDNLSNQALTLFDGESDEKLSDINVDNSTFLSVGIEDDTNQEGLDLKQDDSYNVDQTWCQLCGRFLAQACSEHEAALYVYDSPILSYAEASIPSGLQMVKSDAGELIGIVGKKYYKANTMFGPFVAPLTDSVDQVPDKDHPIPIEVNNQVSYLNPSDEHKCNWMMFVRPAAQSTEQNLAVIQQSDSIYFVSTTSIVYNQELKFGYSPPYAKRHGLNEKLLVTSTAAREVLKCDTCNETFKTKISKKKHMARCRRRHQKFKRESSVIVGAIEKPVDCSPVVPKPSKRLACDECKLGFDRPELFQIHMRSHKEDGDYEKPSDAEVTTPQEKNCLMKKCPACALSFSSMALLLQHITDLHSKRMRRLRVHHNEEEEDDNTEMILDDREIQNTPSKADTVRASGYAAPNDPDNEVKSEEIYSFICTICGKSFTTAGALGNHERSHQRSHYYSCFLCTETFRCTRDVEKHVHTHAVDGLYYCPHCPEKSYESWRKCRKHIATIHTGKQLSCEYCSKVFSRLDKLKLHSLTHTKVKEHMCDVCGKLFNRKDKMLDHMRRVHPQNDEDEEESDRNASKRFKPLVSPSEFHRFIYKCLDCSLGFKRRGMLVNHLARCHPQVPISSVPELNLPILRTQKEFHCLHCNRIYKSSSKRKMHMIKCHPNGSLHSMAKGDNEHDLADAYVNTVGSIPTLPFACENCHKQYANKAKLMAHIRDKHSDVICSDDKAMNQQQIEDSSMSSSMTNNEVLTIMQPLHDNQHEPVTLSLQTINIQDGSRVDNSDLLTHAVSVNELQSTFDFHNQQHQFLAPGHHSAMHPSIEFRLVPGLDLANLQVAGLNTSGLTFALPANSIPSSSHLSHTAHTSIQTTGIPVTTVSSDPRTAWSQFKLSL